MRVPERSGIAAEHSRRAIRNYLRVFQVAPRAAQNAELAEFAEHAGRCVQGRSAVFCGVCLLRILPLRYRNAQAVYNLDIMIRPTVARVDLGALKSNFRRIVEHL